MLRFRKPTWLALRCSAKGLVWSIAFLGWFGCLSLQPCPCATSHTWKRANYLSGHLTLMRASYCCTSCRLSYDEVRFHKNRIIVGSLIIPPLFLWKPFTLLRLNGSLPVAGGALFDIQITWENYWCTLHGLSQWVSFEYFCLLSKTFFYSTCLSGLKMTTPWLCLLLLLLTFVVRMRMVENYCSQRHGSGWKNYCEKVRSRLVPFVLWSM